MVHTAVANTIGVQHWVDLTMVVPSPLATKSSRGEVNRKPQLRIGQMNNAAETWENWSKSEEIFYPFQGNSA